MIVRLFETFSSQKALEDLTEKILSYIAHKTFKSNKGNKISYFQEATLGNFVTVADDEMINFINDYYSLRIIIIDQDNINIKLSQGQYIKTGDNEQYIFLKECPYSIKKYNEYLEEKKDDSNLLIYYLPSSLRYYYSPLLHELQHVYDDWRSKGKYVDTRDTDVDRIDFSSIEDGTATEEERVKIGQNYKKYLNLKHEVDARFTQAINKITFYYLDFDKSIEYNKDYYEMKSFDDVKKQFNRNFHGYIHLSDKDKRRLLSKLGKFYILETENVQKMNKDAKK